MTDSTFMNPLRAGLYLNAANIVDLVIDREQSTALIKITDSTDDKTYILQGEIVEQED